MKTSMTKLSMEAYHPPQGKVFVEAGSKLASTN